METKSLYTRVILTTPMVHNEFIKFFNSTVSGLIARYGEKYIAEPNGTVTPIESIDSDSGVRDVYFDCIADNIQYLKSANNDRKADYTEKSEYAYRTAWREYNRGKKIKRERW